MWAFLLAFLALALGVPVAVLLSLPLPIKIALKFVWKVYCIVGALAVSKWLLSPLFPGIAYVWEGMINVYNTFP